MPTSRRLFWTPTARGDLLKIWRYHAKVTSLDNADRILRKIHDAGRRLDLIETPGRPRDELRDGLRLVLVHPNIIFFRLEDSRIVVVRVLHQRQDVSTFIRPTPE